MCCHAMGEIFFTASAPCVSPLFSLCSRKRDNEAARHGITKNEIDRMASAFGHEDLKQALSG